MDSASETRFTIHSYDEYEPKKQKTMRIPITRILWGLSVPLLAWIIYLMINKSESKDSITGIVLYKAVFVEGDDQNLPNSLKGTYIILHDPYVGIVNVEVDRDQYNEATPGKQMTFNYSYTNGWAVPAMLLIVLGIFYTFWVLAEKIFG